MDIQDFKRWHWMVVGLIVGLVLSYAFSDHDVEGDSALTDREIKQPTFEREAFSRSRESHEPILQSIKVEPPMPDFQKHLMQIVRGERLQYSEKYQKEFRVPFFCYAPNPYTPMALPAGTDIADSKNIHSVIDFLALAKKTLSPPTAPVPAAPWQASIGLNYRYAWEYESRWGTILWGAGGLLVIGGLWPSFLNALVAAGLSKPPKVKSEEDSYLARFSGRGAEEKKKGVKVVDGAEARRLDDLNAAMEKGLAPSGLKHAAASDADLDAEIVSSLATSAASSAAVEIADKEPELSEEERKKRFDAGVFYPVARGPAKKT